MRGHEEPETFDGQVDHLSGERSSCRLYALRKLSDALQGAYRYDEVADHIDTMQMYLNRNIRRGDSTEVQHACHLLSLVVVTMGLEAEALVQSFTSTLVDFLRNLAPRTTPHTPHQPTPCNHTTQSTPCAH